MSNTRVAVVGAGLAGLMGSIWLARSGHEVHLYERAGGPGGRARTTVKEGFQLNIGPHALYKAGHAARALAALGVKVQGRVPPLTGLALYQGQETSLAPPGCAALGFADQARLSGILARLAVGMPGVIAEESVAQWLDRVAPSAGLRAWMEGMVRVSTYANEPTCMRAEAVAGQLGRALRGVLYLDGGWQTLVDGLVERAKEAGVHLHFGAQIRSCARPGSVELEGGSEPADSVVLAVAPAIAARLSGSAQLARFAAEARPVRAACLDLALSSLPAPKRAFLLGLDEPVYASVHSETAKLAPSGGAVMHLARYLGPEPSGERAALESLADRLQPGWRERVVIERFMPSMVVQEALIPWPSPAVPDAPHLRVVGDWVGAEGMLADAASASAAALAPQLGQLAAK